MLATTNNNNTETDAIIQRPPKNCIGFFKEKNRQFAKLAAEKKANERLFYKENFANTKLKQRIFFIIIPTACNTLLRFSSLALLTFDLGRLGCNEDPKTGKCTPSELENLFKLGIRVSGGANIILLLASLSEKVATKYKIKGKKKFIVETAGALAGVLQDTTYKTYFIQELIIRFIQGDSEKPHYISVGTYMGLIFLPALTAGIFASSTNLIEFIAKYYPYIGNNVISKLVQAAPSAASYFYGLITLPGIFDINFFSNRANAIISLGAGITSSSVTGLEFALATDENDTSYIQATTLFNLIYRKLLSAPIYIGLTYIIFSLLKQYATLDTNIETGASISLILFLETAYNILTCLEKEATEAINTTENSNNAENAAEGNQFNYHY
jgi:hypothetical protein